MASLADIPNCGGTTGKFNSGVPICDVIRNIPDGIVLADSGHSFSEADMASKAAFTAAFYRDTLAARGSRIYPMWSLTNFEDQSKEATKISVGNLTTAEIEGVEAIPAFSWQHRKGELYHRLLLNAENENLKIYIVDKNTVVYGTRKSDGSMAPYSLTEFIAGLPKFGTPSAAAYYPFSVTLSDLVEYKYAPMFFQALPAIKSYNGLKDVAIESFSFATNVLKVKLTAVGGDNVSTRFKTELTQTTAWVVKNKTTGLAVIVTATYDSTNEVMALALSGTPFSGASTGDEFTADLAAASVLAATPISISGYESTGPITVLKP